MSVESRDRRPGKLRSFEIDLSGEPSAITYVNFMKANTLRSIVWMWTHALKIERVARQTQGCLLVKRGLTNPREVHIVSYWHDEAALRRYYRHPLHVRLMGLVFAHPDWFTLFNETYKMPVSARYWNEPNGYALSQPPRGQTAAQFYEGEGAPALRLVMGQAAKQHRSHHG